jgi:sec-independent protein translocase protein TatC
MKLHLARRTNPAAGSDPDTDPANDGIGISVLAHLEQLRRRLVYCCISIVVGMLIAFAFINPIFAFVFQPIRGVLPEGSKMIYTQPGEAFSVYVQIALIAGIVFAAPFIMYQIWRLIAPALYQHQKLFALPFIALTTGGFIGGALFNHYIVFRWMIAFFSSFSSFNLTFMPRLDDVFGLYTKMLFGMGLVFQMPAVVFFLAKMGLVTARFLWKNLKYAVLLIFIAAAVITPGGDAATQALFAMPMVGLYILSIVIAWIVGPVARRAGATGDALE